ncbi:tripartite tricarboxylate transporter TctB family protein [Acuticoccus kandeliae]|uniref:tripartite tricarboxylate transporter TctB family protein n=1 Tax=Acuticoccus kandeliae TaxID=2073160 RepID=UPI000D3E33D5|nr:tripartite tricarboxylate transporter TctB family protein [Acuticoccus kandeliae]
MERRVNIAEAAIAGGLLLIALYFGWHAFDYDMGTVRKPGPGAAPLASATLLGVLSAAILVTTMWAPKREDAPDLRAILLAIAGIAAWATLARPLGLLPATFATVLLVGLGERPFRPVRAAATFAVISLAGYLLFVSLLSTPIALIGPY